MPQGRLPTRTVPTTRSVRVSMTEYLYAIGYGRTP